MPIFDQTLRGPLSNRCNANKKDNMIDVATIRNPLTVIALGAFVALVAGCGDNISQSDVDFVATAIPTQFESFRMYSAAVEVSHTAGEGAQPRSGLHQGCEAIIHHAQGHVRESVVLDESGGAFDLDVMRSGDGWVVTSDGLSPPSGNTVAFRTQFTNCVSAIEDKYRAEPERAPFS